MKTTDPEKQGVAKDHYTVQEMMDRLKDGGSPGKRRRRSRQPAKKPSSLKKWLIILAAFLLLCLIATLIIRQFNQWKVESEGFRATLSERLRQIVKRDVVLERCKADDWNEVTTTSLKLPLDPDTLIKSGEITRVRASMSSGTFFSNEWDIRHLSIGKMDLAFQSPKSTTQPGSKLGGSHPTLTSRETLTAKSSGWKMGITPTPDFIALEGFGITELFLSWPSAPGFEDFQLLNSEAHGNAVGGSISLNLNGGTLQMGTLKNVQLTSAKVDVAWPIARVNPLVLSVGSGHINMQGTVDLATTTTSLTGSGDGILLGAFLTPLWKERIFGSMSLKNLAYEVAPGSPPTLKGSFLLNAPVFQNIPLLNSLGDTFDSNLLRKLEFASVTGDFTHTPDKLILENIVAHRLGLAKITGRITLEKDGTLQGTLRLALNVPRGTPAFNDVQDELSWTEVKLSGTETEMIDDLTPRLAPPKSNGTPTQTTPDPTTPAPPPPPAPAPDTTPDPLGTEKENLEKAFEKLLEQE